MARSQKPGQPDQLGSYEEALSQSFNYPELLFSRLIKTVVARISSWQEQMIFNRHTCLLNSLGS